MLSPLRVEMPAERYARAVYALYRVRRCWHRLGDATLVATKPGRGSEAHLEAAWKALWDLDRHLGRLTDLLTR